MKHLKIRNAAKGITSVVISLAILVAIVYTLLTYGEVIPVTFNWLHLANVGVVTAALLVIALILYIISCGVKKKDMKKLAEQQAAEEALAACKEANASYVRPVTRVAGGTRRNNNTVNINVQIHNTKKEAPVPAENVDEADAGKKKWFDLERVKNFKPDSPKKIAMIAVPAVAVTAGLVAIGVKARRKRKVRRLLRDLERALGIKR